MKNNEQRLHKLIYLQNKMKLKYMRCICSIWFKPSVKALRHWSVAWHFILKLQTGSRPAPAAAPSWLQQRAARTSQAAGGGETPVRVGWSEATKRTELASRGVDRGVTSVQSASCSSSSTPRQDERVLEVRTLWTAAARSGEQDLVERSWFSQRRCPRPRTLAVKSWGGFLTSAFFFFPLSPNCSQRREDAQDSNAVLWVSGKFKGELRLFVLLLNAWRNLKGWYLLSQRDTFILGR